ncbi:MAG: ATP-binding protein [Hymenobacter sp.]|nr:MAG: ATP-binding protein [Hymenobacter sp.]
MAQFKTRARTVDMLGRQQISGIPTAISELFKNAHDAYADRVEVDYYRQDRLFMLRDDGLGMTLQDFTTRWLTLGTESKLGVKAGLALPPRAPGKTPRPVLGEKGIGRLAIAAIGPQLFVLTRAKRDEMVSDLVVAYIHWNIFAQPGIDLDAIEIPVRTFPEGRLPTKQDAEEMLQEFAVNLDRLPYATQEELAVFRKDFATAALDLAELDAILPDMSLNGTGHGTHFVIIPAYQIFEDDIDAGDATAASALDKALLGFTNQMTPGHLPPVITAAFRDHQPDRPVRDLIDKDRFFTPREFLSADHHFKGEFDKFGHFHGTVSVYRQSPVPYQLAWPEAKGKPTQCGPFAINIAYIQGSKAQSTVSIQDYGDLIQKTDRFGGIYIYKNGIRILPYGQTSFDWLEIEKRRSMKASRYFFSHRRMFGVVEIDENLNANLSEKAGREGFRENKAYREFRDILKHIFLQLATDFFNQDGAYSEEFLERRGEMERLDKARKKQQTQSVAKRRLFRAELNDFLEAFENEEPEQEAMSLALQLREDLDAAVAHTEAGRASYEVLQVDARARQQFRKLEERYRIIRPKGVAIPKADEREYSDYQVRYQQLQEKVFAVVRELIEGEITQAADKARLELDRRLRVENSLKELAADAESTTRNERKDTLDLLEAVDRLVHQSTNTTVAEVTAEVREVLIEFNSIDFLSLTEAAAAETRRRLENRIIQLTEQKRDELRSLRTRLTAVRTDNEITTAEHLEALEQQVLGLEEKADLELELSQLGMALEVINHEFDANITGIREGLGELQRWASANQPLGEVYELLRHNFDHLDGYLSLFTPLQRRLYRQKLELTGRQIGAYLQRLFVQRFIANDILFEQTDAFKEHTVTGYPSSFYPVFVNLVDNAVYWLQQRDPPRKLLLDADEHAFYISNNGPELLSSRSESIFELGVSYRPGGRGLGLSIAREVLEKEGFMLRVVQPPRPGMNITFQVMKK